MFSVAPNSHVCWELFQKNSGTFCVKKVETFVRLVGACYFWNCDLDWSYQAFLQIHSACCVTKIFWEPDVVFRWLSSQHCFTVVDNHFCHWRVKTNLWTARKCKSRIKLWIKNATWWKKRSQRKSWRKFLKRIQATMFKIISSFKTQPINFRLRIFGLTEKKSHWDEPPTNLLLLLNSFRSKNCWARFGFVKECV